MDDLPVIHLCLFGCKLSIHQAARLSPSHLQTHDPSIPLPSPILLRTHSSIAKILNVSGLAQKLDQLIDTPELYSQINPNGSTNLGLILAQKLLQFDY